jgi:hypothetical protein
MASTERIVERGGRMERVDRARAPRIDRAEVAAIFAGGFVSG